MAEKKRSTPTKPPPETLESSSVIKNDASVGTGLWALNRLSSDALPHLLKDLLWLEPSGLKPEDCTKVQTALKQIWIQAAEIPDRGLLPISIQHDIERFLNNYVKWNDPQGNHPHSVKERQVALKRLINRRHKMATRLRKRHHILSNNLDLRVVDGMYEALAELPKALPDIFKNLTKAIASYNSRKSE